MKQKPLKKQLIEQFYHKNKLFFYHRNHRSPADRITQSDPLMADPAAD